MALKAQSLFLFGYTVDVSNQYINFQSVNAGTIYTAIIANGTYSLTDLLAEIAAVMSNADAGGNTYTVTADRSYNNGTENRVSISTSGSYLKILFGTGLQAAASIASEIGFLSTDYSGGTTYTGSFTSGTSLVPVIVGYNYVSPNRNHKVFGNVNVSAVGLKEAIVFQIQKFFEVAFRYEPESRVENLWQTFFDWVIQQRAIEFIPEITNSSVFYNCTLEQTEEDGQGLAFMMKEMLPEYPGLFETGKLKFRQSVQAPTLIL